MVFYNPIKYQYILIKYCKCTKYKAHLNTKFKGACVNTYVFFGDGSLVMLLYKTRIDQLVRHLQLFSLVKNYFVCVCMHVCPCIHAKYEYVNDICKNIDILIYLTTSYAYIRNNYYICTKLIHYKATQTLD